MFLNTGQEVIFFFFKCDTRLGQQAEPQNETSVIGCSNAKSITGSHFIFKPCSSKLILRTTMNH